MPADEDVARKWIIHHLDAASAYAKQAEDEQAQRLIDGAIEAIRVTWRMIQTPP